MKKRFLAIAIASGLASPFAASADATVYGKVHLSISAVDACTTAATCAGTSDEDNWQVNSHASRLGFKGEEDLGNGLAATYKLEYEVNPDGASSDSSSGTDSSAGLKRRNQYLGLKGGFGELRVGRHDTPMKMSQGKFDLFNDTVADIAGPGALDISRADRRVDNVIAYLGKASDIKYAVALIPGEGDGVSAGDGPADTVSAAVMYDGGPLFVSLGLDSNDDTGAAGSFIEDTTRLTATYSMGKMRFGLMFETEGTTDGTGEQDVMALNFAMGMGKNKVKFQYINSDDDAIEKTQATLGYDIGLSKRTTAYVLYTDGDVENAGGITQGEVSALSLGMVHNF